MVLLCVFVLGRVSAAEVTGRVTEVSGSTATVETSGRTPMIGAKVDIYFTLQGTDDEISVGTGRVVSKDGTSVKVKIEDATGEVAKDQLARFAGESEPAVTKATPPPKETPVEKQSEATPTPTRTLPASVPFPSASPKTKTATTPAQAQIDPNVMALLQQGASQHAAGNLDAAIASYTSALRIAPNSGVAYLNRASSYLYKGNFQAALADANKALELTVPKMDDVYNVRGTAKAGLLDYDGAIADCNRALKIDPKNWLAYNNRANNRLRKGDYAGTLADCNKAISLNSGSALGYYNRGFAKTNLGDQAGALADWQKAVSLQASFGAELNPKIAQLQAMGIRASSTATTSSKAPAQPEWTDLTNAPQKLVGTWEGGRHRTQYFANGTFVTDPHLVPDPPRAQWQIQGDRLVEYFPQANMTTTHNILSLTSKELVLRNANGQTFRKTRVGR
jgi:Flp pilus assembly protein TadD